MNKITKKIVVNGRELIIETGELAKQASGAVKVSYGETVILAACCVADGNPNLNFFPLTVDYRERTYAAGKIPGGFFKREGRPSEKEVITSRVIDRPIRPLFPKGYKDEVQVSVTVLSTDGENDADIPAMIGGSCAIALSPAPFNGPIGAVRIGRVGGNLVINPTYQELEGSDFELVVAGKNTGITMLEGKSEELPEELILQAIEIAEPVLKQIVDIQQELVDEAGAEKNEFIPFEVNEEIASKVRGVAQERIIEIYKKALSKPDRKKELSLLKKEVLEAVAEPENEDDINSVKEAFGELEKTLLRSLLVNDRLRVDGRKPEELRPITCLNGVLPRTHGSGIFTKGETQALSVVTLGTKSDQQIMDVLEGEYRKRFMLHYNFPAYSVGEVRPNRGPGRREIGHGLLAEKAIQPSLPSKEDFPYTIRLVCDILESNGSSSMASVCAGTIALMDAGVPLKSPVIGVGMGIVEDVILTDIAGDEDHAGDMDFKVAGTEEGVTAIQMDIKVSGISKEILKKALEQARIARLATIGEVKKVISKPKAELSPYAPMLKMLKIDTDKIGMLIGPGGKNIKMLQEVTGSTIEIEDDGTVTVSCRLNENVDIVAEVIEFYNDNVQPGKIFKGTVKNILDFGAFVEIVPGIEGLVHISEIAPFRVEKVTDVLNVGDKVDVLYLGKDDRGRIKLSRKKALTESEENNKG